MIMMQLELAQDLRDFLADCQIDHDPLNMESALDPARIMRWALL